MSKMVREVNWAGPCIDRGTLTKETEKFYVYRSRGGRMFRISKRKVHLEPCQRCMDHPETYYPRGYEG